MFSYSLGAGAELRIFERRHAAALLEFISQNRAYLGAWLGWANRIATVAEAEEFLQRGLNRFAEDGLPWVGIWQDDQLVGGILFFPLDQVVHSTEIGYWLGQGASGRGLMGRAIQAMLGYLFNELKVNRVALQAQVENTRSRALAERLGFRFEGIRRQTWINGEQLVDMAGYAMLADDWRAPG